MALLMPSRWRALLIAEANSPTAWWGWLLAATGLGISLSLTTSKLRCSRAGAGGLGFWVLVTLFFLWTVVHCCPLEGEAAAATGAKVFVFSLLEGEGKGEGGWGDRRWWRQSLWGVCPCPGDGWGWFRRPHRSWRHKGRWRRRRRGWRWRGSPSLRTSRSTGGLRHGDGGGAMLERPKSHVDALKQLMLLLVLLCGCDGLPG